MKFDTSSKDKLSCAAPRFFLRNWSSTYFERRQYVKYSGLIASFFKRMIANAWLVFAGKMSSETIAVLPIAPAIENKRSPFCNCERLKASWHSLETCMNVFFNNLPSSEIFSILTKLIPVSVNSNPAVVGVVPLVIRIDMSLSLIGLSKQPLNISINLDLIRSSR